MDISRTFSKINGVFGRKSRILSAHVFSVHADGVPLEFCEGCGALKIRTMPYQKVEKIVNIFIRLDTISAFYRETSGRAD